ncbi:hypothetical protein [Jiangella endophytica]|uniref:hypothetical protein n=1 Tax=Jiangella endophytica TaxID=1623398 RepID=UPI0013002859|nr:hypothetical protein [Jiangella endophytica]
MNHDEKREPAEGLASANRGERVTPASVEEYAESVYDAMPVHEGENTIEWNDPRAARFRRAVAAEASKKGRAKRRAREAEAQVEALTQEIERMKASEAKAIDDVYRLVSGLVSEREALKERFREVYAALQELKFRESAASSDGTTLMQDSERPVELSGAPGLSA